MQLSTISQRVPQTCNGFGSTLTVAPLFGSSYWLNGCSDETPPALVFTRMQDFTFLWFLGDGMAEDCLSCWRGVRRSEKANAEWLQQADLLRQVMLRAESYDAHGRSQAAATGPNLCRMQKEETGIQKGPSPRLETVPVALRQVGQIDLVDHVEEAQAKTITRVGIKVADFLVTVREWWGGYTDKESHHGRRGIWNLIAAERGFDTG
jgi:hypothetical protein